MLLCLFRRSDTGRKKVWKEELSVSLVFFNLDGKGTGMN